MEEQLIYHNKVSNCTILGPYQRSVIWVSGCCFHCDGCIASGFKDGRGSKVSTAELAKWFLQSGNEHLTISGGEPMLQAKALVDMINKIKKVKDIGIIVYSGFLYQDLLNKKDSDIDELLSIIDILIDGPYIKELDYGKPYIGSSNQKIIQLTDRYKEVVQEYYFNSEERRIEVQFEEKRTVLIGVPSQRQRDFWNMIKEGYEDGTDDYM